MIFHFAFKTLRLKSNLSHKHDTISCFHWLHCDIGHCKRMPEESSVLSAWMTWMTRDKRMEVKRRGQRKERQLNVFDRRETCVLCLQVMEKSNSLRGRDPGKHECLKLASHSTSGGFVLVNLFPSHTQTHTHSNTLRRSRSLTHSLHPSWPFMYQWLHW